MGQVSEQPISAPMVRERRAYPRAALRTPTLVDSGSSWQKCESVNVSAGGMAVRTERTIKVGAIVEVYFELPFSVAIETQARVVRSADGIVAVQFVDLDHNSLVALRAYCRVSTQMRAVRVGER
jgi:hypothetical protein